MATSEILAVGTSNASSTDVVVTNQPKKVGIKSAGSAGTIVPIADNARLELLEKTGSGDCPAAYRDRGVASGVVLDRFNSSILISAPGTYYLRRSAGVSCGAYVDDGT